MIWTPNTLLDDFLAAATIGKIELSLDAISTEMRTGTIKVKQRAQRSVLKGVVKAMNDYFRTSSASTNFISCVFLIVLGIAMAMLALESTVFIDIF